MANTYKDHAFCLQILWCQRIYLALRSLEVYLCISYHFFVFSFFSALFLFLCFYHVLVQSLGGPLFCPSSHFAPPVISAGFLSSLQTDEAPNFADLVPQAALFLAENHENFCCATLQSAAWLLLDAWQKTGVLRVFVFKGQIATTKREVIYLFDINGCHVVKLLIASRLGLPVGLFDMSSGFLSRGGTPKSYKLLDHFSIF
jgi:hypothetical protein